MGKYTKKSPVNPHKTFKRNVKANLNELYRDLAPNKLSREDLENKIRDRLGVIMEESFKKYFEDSGYKGNITKLAFNENGSFFIESPDDLLNSLELTEAEIDGYKEFFDSYSAKITAQFNSDAEELAAFIMEDRPLKEINIKINELNEQLYKNLGAIACVILSKVCIVGLLAGVASIGTGAGPIIFSAGALTSGVAFLLSDSQAVVKTLSSMSGIISMSAQIIEHKMAVGDIDKMFKQIGEDRKGGMFNLKDIPEGPFEANLYVLSNTIHKVLAKDIGLEVGV